MVISDVVEVERIKRYAQLLRREDALKMELSLINDELINLSVFMTNEDINEANQLYRSDDE